MEQLIDPSAVTTAPSAAIGELAADAWRRALPAGREPARVDVLKNTARSSVVRLVGAGADGQPIIAKRSRPEAVRREHMVYTEILPAIGLPYVRYRGTLEDSDRAWLFVEDAGGRRCARTEQPVSLARWLACLHTGGSLLPLSGRLPSRSAAHYREHLDAAVRLIAENRENSWLRPEERSVLDALLAGLRAVARDWLELTSETAALPATVVHADLKPSNIRVQTSAGEASVLVFDWEHCGWGTPASDLGALGYHLGLCHYWSALAGRWDGLQTSDVLRAARLGRLFRVLAGVHWAAMHLSYEWRSDRTTMRRSDLRLRFYRGELETVLSLLCSPRMRGRSRTQMISRAAR